MSFFWALHSESLDKQEPANQKPSAQIWIKFDSEKFIRTRIRSSHPKVFSTEVMSPDIFSHVALIHQDAHGANVLAPFLADIFQRLGLHATTSAPQGLVDYMTSQWINSTTFPPSSRSIYGLPIHSSDIEGLYTSLNRCTCGRTHLPFYLLLQLLHGDSYAPSKCVLSTPGS